MAAAFSKRPIFGSTTISQTQLKNRDLGGTVLTYSEIRAGVGADWKISSVLP